MGKAPYQDSEDASIQRVRDDEYEWEHIRSALANWDASELAQAVAVATIRESIDCHAYLLSEIQTLRDILGAKVSVWPDDRLFRYTDEFAIYVGLALRTERKLSSAKRLGEIHSRLVEPATTLLESLQDPDFLKEFLVPWSGLKTVDTDSLVDELIKIISGSRAHVATINSHGAKGPSSDSDLKSHFVTMVAVLCECIDHEFEPKRKTQFNKAEHTQFSEAVYLLAKPLFLPDVTRQRLTFDGAIREHVDAWNANKKAFLASRQV